MNEVKKAELTLSEILHEQYLADSAATEAREREYQASTDMTDEEIITAFRRLMNTGKINDDLLWEISFEMHGALGAYPLASACVGDILEAAGHYWSNSREELAGIADDAAASIARHWEGYRDETNDLAIEYIEDNAGHKGIELRPRVPSPTTIAPTGASGPTTVVEN